MAVQNGKDLLIKVDLIGDGQFVTVAGLRATRIAFNAETVDVTSLDSSGGWRELLGGAGVKSASISGWGCFAMPTPTSGRGRSSLMPKCRISKWSSPVLALWKGRFRSPRSSIRATTMARQLMRCRLPRLVC